jgi:NAD(P)-dependent dehydrogenase (short-subunit alcohol dehydrogenase family)
VGRGHPLARTLAQLEREQVGGHIGFPGLGHYVVAKHGVLGPTKTAAMECAPNRIRVSAVSPGLIDTPMADRFTGGPDSGAEHFFLALQPLLRQGTPAEVAASFVTGHALAVDGGFLTI